MPVSLTVNALTAGLQNLCKMKFCANLSFMFVSEALSILDRYQMAANANFKTVETGFPFGCSLEDVVSAKTNSGVEQVLINLFTGDTSKGELGVTFVPGKEHEFRTNLQTSIQFARALNCSLLHIMAGVVLEPVTPEHWATYEGNLKDAAKELEKENIVGLIEPINNHSVPNYFLQSYDKAVEIIKRINSPSLKLMMDLFHMQHIAGDLTKNIDKYLPYTGHVQIAQVPNRNEPNTPGEVNYKYVLNYLAQSGYNGFVGLEYRPLNGTVDGLKWIEELGFEPL